ncbi:MULTISPECIES: SIR2 family protein [Clavibacter]|nr:MULTISPECIES: SIR2 family protein [Clavibacter]MDA3805353.1 SIR2 family protein [Clavibacter sp. CT19]
MSASDLTADVMAQFRNAGVDAHTTLLLGAGASTTSGLPDWDELATRLLVSSGAVSNEESARTLVSRQDPMMVVESARALHGPSWNKKLRAALYEGVLSPESSPLHLAAVAHALGGSPGDTTLVTLNFDTLLEDALQEETGAPVESVADGRDVTDMAVHHLHGVVSTSATTEAVLTLTEFLDLMSDPDSWQLRNLRAAVGRGAVVIAGTSYRDPDVRQWMHDAMRGAPDSHATLILLARQGLAVTKQEFEDLRSALTEQWSAIGMRPVLVNDFSDAAQVIRELRFIDAPHYRAPQERAEAVWTYHALNFARLQEEYVAELAQNAQTLSDAFSVDSMNLTLWLANSEGKLARWAAQDRRYLDPNGLRMVETGFDSPWIAGQSLGSDTLLHKDLPEGDIRRWSSVLAVPIPVTHPEFPTVTSAVVTIGLPDRAETYAGSRFLWADAVSKIGDAWTSRISDAVFPR